METPNIVIELYKSSSSSPPLPLNAELLKHATDKTPLIKVEHKIKFFYRGTSLCCDDEMAFDYHHYGKNGYYKETWGIHPKLIEWANKQDAFWEFYNENFIELSKRPTYVGMHRIL